MTFKQLKKVDNRLKHLVNCWIRQKQRKFQLENILNLIIARCILYCFIQEKFSECGQVMKIFNGDTINNDNEYDYNFDHGSAFGQVNLNCIKFDCMSWTFHINHLSISNKVFSGLACIIIGITNMRSTHLNKNIFKDDSLYGLSSFGQVFTMVKGRCDEDSAGTFKEGDTITMIYRRKDKLLQFMKNYTIQIAILENVLFNTNEEVNMVVALRDWWWMKHASVTLLNFTAFK